MILLLYTSVFFFLRHAILLFQYKEFFPELFDFFFPSTLSPFSPSKERKSGNQRTVTTEKRYEKGAWGW